MKFVSWLGFTALAGAGAWYLFSEKVTSTERITAKEGGGAKHPYAFSDLGGTSFPKEPGLVILEAKLVNINDSPYRLTVQYDGPNPDGTAHGTVVSTMSPTASPRPGARVTFKAQNILPT